MKNDFAAGSLFCTAILIIPIITVAIGGPENQDQLIVLAFVFYPCVSMCLYFVWLFTVWTGVWTTEYDVILHKPGLLPKGINIPIKAVRSIKMEKRATSGESGVLYMYKASICLWDGGEVSLGDLPLLSAKTVANLRKAAASAKLHARDGDTPWGIETKVQFLPIFLFLALVAGGVAYYLFLCAKMAP